MPPGHGPVEMLARSTEEVSAWRTISDNGLSCQCELGFPAENKGLTLRMAPLLSFSDSFAPFAPGLMGKNSKTASSTLLLGV